MTHWAICKSSGLTQSWVLKDFPILLCCKTDFYVEQWLLDDIQVMRELSLNIHHFIWSVKQEGKHHSAKYKWPRVLSVLTPHTGHQLMMDSNDWHKKVWQASALCYSTVKHSYLFSVNSHRQHHTTLTDFSSSSSSSSSTHQGEFTCSTISILLQSILPQGTT